MSSLVVFPFKTERPEVVIANIEVAASHDAVGEVLCVGYEEEDTYRAIAGVAGDIEARFNTPVSLELQERIGTRRSGKGDGMNTGIAYFVSSKHSRLHFYDADITSFGGHWITKAERAADLGYDLVRHYFPRSSTDAMITWMITRTGFAMLFPNTELPWIEQPLGGELLLSREAAETLALDSSMTAQSDWGIDTLLTFCSVKHRMPMFEVYIPQGKTHALYGHLTDLRQMLIECFLAMRGLRDTAIEGGATHHAEPPDLVPESIAENVGYDVEGTMQLVPESWSGRQAELLSYFPVPVRDGMLAAGRHTAFSFMDEWAWYDVYRTLLDEFVEGDPDWEDLLFHLWMVRVLAYTHDVALRGYGYAQRYLRGMVYRYLYRAATGAILADGD